MSLQVSKQPLLRILCMRRTPWTLKLVKFPPWVLILLLVSKYIYGSVLMRLIGSQIFWFSHFSNTAFPWVSILSNSPNLVPQFSAFGLGWYLESFDFVCICHSEICYVWRTLIWQTKSAGKNQSGWDEWRWRMSKWDRQSTCESGKWMHLNISRRSCLAHGILHAVHIDVD